MAYYAIPVYVGLSCVLSLSYSCIECAKDNGKLDTATNLILCAWVIVSAVVASVISGVTAEIMTKQINYMHILIALILACVTLSISSSIIYWS